MEEHKTYRLSEITVNADELRRIKDLINEQGLAWLELSSRIENLINQGTITKHAKVTTEELASQEDD